MKQFNGLTESEKAEIKDKALSWYEQHKDHVDMISEGAVTDKISPSGSDLFRPELWKGIHWLWFFSWQNMNADKKLNMNPSIPKKESLWDKLKKKILK